MKASAGKRGRAPHQQRPRRVLMLIENTTYPLDVRVRCESQALIAAGYQVAVICQRGRQARRGQAGRAIWQPWHETLDGVEVFRYPAAPQAKTLAGYAVEYPYSLLVTFLLSLVVWARRGFDVIHAANPPDTAVFIAGFYRLFGVRFVFDHHDLAPDMYLARANGKPNRLVYAALRWMERLSFRWADHVIATNESYKRVAMERGGVPEARITVVRNGPDLNRFRLTAPDPELRSPGQTLIGYIGVMGPQDGVDYLLRALAALRTSLGREDFYCVIIGSGTSLGDLRGHAAHLGLDGHVWFTGFIPDEDVIRTLSTVDIGVDPDPSNGFNDRCTMIKLMEYMALSKPVVAFDLPEHRVTAGASALYAQPNDELDFARQLAALMDDPARRARMGAVGRQRIECELAWPHQAPHLLAAYASLAPAAAEPVLGGR